MDTQTITPVSSQRLHQRENPEQVRATGRIATAVKNGLLQRPSFCTACLTKTPDIEGHHLDYRLPLLVVWLCHPCHMRFHVEGIAGLPATNGKLLPKKNRVGVIKQTRPRPCELCKAAVWTTSTEAHIPLVRPSGEPFPIMQQIRHCDACTDLADIRLNEKVDDCLKRCTFVEESITHFMQRISYRKRRAAQPG